MTEPHETRVIAVTSGKGGAGKTTLSLNLAMALASSGFRTCLFDADLGLANVSVLLGLSAPQTLEDVICGQSVLEDVVLRDVHGFDIIPGASGVQQLADLPPERVTTLVRSFSLLEAYDVVLMDTSAGVAKSVIAFCLCAPELLLVVNPEPASLTDAYAVLKILRLNGFQGKVRVVVSRCKNVAEAKAFFGKFQETVLHYLNMRPRLLGVVVQDRKVQDAIRKREPVLFRHPGSNASRCIRHIAKSLVDRHPDTTQPRNRSSFWERWLQRLRAPLDMGAAESDEERREMPDAIPSPPSSGLPDTETAQKNQQEEASASPGTPDPLAQQLQALTLELRGVRIAVESLVSSGLEAPAARSRSSSFKQGASMLLDFDAFVERYRSKKGGNPA